jgi:DNA-binding MarR family transcriptional regulator
MSYELMRELAAHGHPDVRFAHGNVLQFLDDEGTRVGVLAERAQVSKQAMAQLVAHLEEHGYVERVPDPHDRRATLVQATERGREVFAIARSLMAHIDARLRQRLGDTKVEQLRTLLQELDAAL